MEILCVTADLWTGLFIQAQVTADRIHLDEGLLLPYKYSAVQSPFAGH